MSVPGATGPAPNEGNAAAGGVAKQQLVNTGFEMSPEETKELLARSAVRKQQNEVLGANAASEKQSGQRAAPNTGNPAALPPANAAIASPATSPRAVPIGGLPPIPPKRKWLHGNDLMRGAVSMIVAPGARAKTTWLLTCALACASGRPLLGAKVYGGPLTTLYLSAEDSTNEIALRIRAAMRRHNLGDVDVAKLYVIGADQWGLPLLSPAGGAAKIHQIGWSTLISELDRIQPDVLIIDPLINIMGGVAVNENSGAGLLMGELAALAAKRRIAVMIAHHASKGRDLKSAESAMGAATLTNLCRIVLAIEWLDPKDAGLIGLPSWETTVFRVVGTKQNYSRPDESDRWFRLQTVEIENQELPLYVTGDKVAVVEEFHPSSSEATFPPELIRAALRALDSADPPLSPSKSASTRYAVPEIAKAIAPHRGGRADEMGAKNVLDHLIRCNLVRVENVKLSRAGSRADTRKGLVLTLAGKAAMQRDTEVASNPPQSPQSPAA